MKKALFFWVFTLVFCDVSFSQNNSFLLDGTNDYVQTTFPGVFGTTPRTFEAWVKVPSVPTSNKCITDYGRDAVGSRNTFIINGSGLIGYISGGTNANITATTGAIVAGVWTHVAFVYDGTNGFLYKDGVQVGTGSLTTVNTPSTGTLTDLRIGQRVPPGSIPFDGNIDEVRIWNDARTQAEIMANMNTELAGTEANLVYYAKADDDNASCDVIDCAANNHGMLVNGAQFDADVPPIADVGCGVTLLNCTVTCVAVNASSGTTAATLKNPIGFCPGTAQIDAICDCPVGYVAVGYEGFEGNVYGANVLSSFSLRCKQLNQNGTLGAAVTVTCSNGTVMANTATGPDDAGANQALVGADLRIGCAADALIGRSKSITDIAAGLPNTTNTTMTGIGGTGGTSSITLVPDGNVIVGMQTYIEGVNTPAGAMGLSAGVAWRYAPITSCCEITSIAVSNISACDNNNTPLDPSDDTFTADVTVTYVNPPSTGTLDLSGPTLTTQSQTATGTSHTFIGVTFSADGNPINLTATFSADPTCTLTNTNAGTPPVCSNCSISAISFTGGTCDDNNTPGDPSDDFYTTNITVTYANPPATGTLDLTFANGGNSVSATVSGTSHTFTGVVLPANGAPVMVNATFSADSNCTLSQNVGTAPAPCSASICVITNISISNISACDNNGTGDQDDDTFTADVTVSYAIPPATGTLNLGVDATASVPVSGIGANSYTFTNLTLSADGGSIDLNAVFSDLPACALTQSVGTAPDNCSHGADITNEGGPNIADPCTCISNGEFSEEVVIGPSAPGQAWAVTSSTLINPLTGGPYQAGTLFNELPSSTPGLSIYVLEGRHTDGLGYNMTATSPFFPDLPLKISNLCFYPKPEFDNDFSALCLNSNFTLSGNAGAATGVGTFKINGVDATELDATALGLGFHTVEFCFDAGDALGFLLINDIAVGAPDGANTIEEAENDPGCVACISQLFQIIETPSQVTCNDRIQVSLNENCEFLVTPDMVLEGSYGCYDDYIVSITQGTSPIANPITGSTIGRELTATVTHIHSGNSCWGKINVEDKLGPKFNCQIELLDKAGVSLDMDGIIDDKISITCDVDPASIPAPVAIDNCDPSPYVSLANEEITGGNCSILTIKRTYNSTDIYGNAGESCMITINVEQPEIAFPDDVTWSCQQYNAFANVIDATAMHPLIIANAAGMDQSLLCCIAGLGGDDVPGVDPYGPGAYWMDTEDLDVTLDPLYNDDVDNPITDGNGACGNATAETDELECVANFGYMVGCPYLQDCDIAPPTAHAPQIIQVPIFQPPFAPPFLPTDIKRGLEDVDVLELTGSGQPNVVGLNCNFSVTHTDHRLEACEGLGTDGSVFKILRTWTVLNWCTGQTFTDIQIIKVLDRKAPTITFGDDYNDELVSNVPSSGAHPDCRSNGLIDVPTFADDCSGIGTVSVSTPFGNAVAVENNGVVVGYRVEAPYMPMGTHTIVFTVEDACGNRTTANRQITVIDGIPPVPVCRELTQVALGGEPDGITSVGAEFFDEGSYDYCSSVYFKVRRMERFGCDKANVDTNGEINNPDRTNDDQEWFDDKVKFCCEDIGNDVTVILRVYDVDPGTGEINTNQSAATGFSHVRGIKNGVLYNHAILNGTYNDCMIQVTVEDKVRPTCVAPADVWLNCNDLPDNVDYEDIDQLNDLFGSAIANDNCNATIEDLNPNVQVDLCGVGTIIRDYRAVDDYGNRSIGRCRQTVMIMAQNEYTLLVPGDFEEECDDASPRDFEYEERACDLFALNFEDREFPASTNGECKKIIRTWQLINWCEYDGASNALVLPRLDLNLDGEAGDGEGGSNNPVTGVRHAATHQWVSNGDIMILNMNPANTAPSTGYYSYEQHIKIFDNTAPDVTYSGPTDFCGGDLNNDPCDGQVDIAPTISDLCTATSHRWELSAFSTTFGSADFSGNGDFSGRYPLGVHTVRFYVEDECGNISHLDVTFEITDCKLPTPVCHNGLSIDIMPLAKMVELWAIDFDASSFDYCTAPGDLQYRVNRVTDRNNDGVITPDDYITRVPAFDSVQFVCSDVGLLVNIQFWVGDAAGNWDYCVTYVDVQDNNNACVGSRPASIAGTTKTETGVGVAKVDVTISGDMNSMLTTDNGGDFTFNNLVEGNDYTVTPMRNDDIDNGVSTYDLALISKHVRNVELLDSPYKMIAADANNSGNISTLDLVAIRKVILFVAAEFPNNTSWRFIDKDQILNPTNPFASSIIEAANINNIVGDESADFIAVKVGDVSGDAEAQDVASIDDRTFNGTFFFNANDVAFEAGEEVVVEFTSAQLAEIEGYQFTMNFDNKALSLVEIQEGTANQENFGQTMVDKGILTASWNGTAQSEVAFKLVFNAINAGTLSEALSISSEYTQAEAYTTGGQLQNVGIDFGTTTTAAEFALYQNTPNPFKGETTIGFNLPEAAAATISVSDVSGKVIKVVTGDFAQGYNQVTLNSNELANGVLYYQLDTDNYTATKKMIIIE